MAGRRSLRGFTHWPILGWLARSVGGDSHVGALAAFAVPMAAAAWFIPAPLLLPALSAFLIGSAALVVLFARLGRVRFDHDRVTAWDVAGALAFIGFAAAMLGKPDHVAGWLSAVSIAP